MRRATLSITSGLALTAVLAFAASADAHGRKASAALHTADGRELGSVEFRTRHDYTEVRVRLSDAPGTGAFHGFHVHANDVGTNGAGCIADAAAASSTWFVSADGHYNPTAASHGAHAGDLPVVYVNGDGAVETRFAIDRIAPADLDGKVVILHAAADNFGNVPVGAAAAQYTANSPDATGATARTGNAGDRIACGVITAR